MEERLSSILSSYEAKRDKLIPILQQVQEEFGYLPEQTMLEIAQFANVPESQVYAVATFYAQFRFTPIGRKHVTVCRGTACHVRGAPRILEEVKKQLGINEGETTSDLEYSLETVACIGACGLAPNIVINKETFGRLTVKRITEIFSDIQSKGKKEQDEK
ncbi:MAG: NADH-quinone oxidoreductase subunit NuoE [Planctomycetota bacterium]|jgi:NADH-quinone oxidoreductase subunit E